LVSDVFISPRYLGVGAHIGGIGAALAEDDADVIVRPTRLVDLTDVDRLADRLLQPLIEQFDDVAVVRDAVPMAIGELCQNAVEHGANPAGCVVAASRGEVDGMSRIMLSIGDRGIGIPEHIRGSHPELVVNEHAIAQALQEALCEPPNSNSSPRRPPALILSLHHPAYRHNHPSRRQSLCPQQRAKGGQS
jgi:hypothetical protein